MSVKKIVFFSIIIGSVFIIHNLATSILTLWEKRQVVVQAQRELDREKKENKELKEKLTNVKSPYFIESEARNKLFLAKPGEGVVVIPSEALQASHAAKQQKQDTRQNWEKWRDLLFQP